MGKEGGEMKPQGWEIGSLPLQQPLVGTGLGGPPMDGWMAAQAVSASLWQTWKQKGKQNLVFCFLHI